MRIVNEIGRGTMTANMSAPETSLPYVISADASGLMRKFERRYGHVLRSPSEAFFKDLAQELKSNVSYATGHEAVLVEQADLHRGMEELVIASDVPVISQDRAYFSDGDPHIAAHLDVTRAVDPDFRKLGLMPRPDALPFQTQLSMIAEIVEGDEIAIVDDVIYSAEGAIEIINHLAERGKKVVRAIAGIAIGDGKNILEDLGVEVQSVYTYETVIDEVCERDFLAGIPMSGRTVYAPDGSWWSAPYFEPFGNAETWASIPPERTLDFSKFCLEQSIELWQATDEASGRQVLVHELPRPLNVTTDENEPVVEALRRVQELIEVS